VRTRQGVDVSAETVQRGDAQVHGETAREHPTGVLSEAHREFARTKPLGDERTASGVRCSVVACDLQLLES
jgi:hypothetical protein